MQITLHFLTKLKTIDVIYPEITGVKEDALVKVFRSQANIVRNVNDAYSPRAGIVPAKNSKECIGTYSCKFITPTVFRHGILTEVQTERY